MEIYTLSKNEAFEYSTEFLDKSMIDRIRKLDLSGLSLKSAQGTVEALSSLKKTETVEAIEQVFEPEAIDLDGVHFDKNEDIEKIVDKVFEYAEADDDIGRLAIRNRLKGESPKNNAQKVKPVFVQLSASDIDSKVNMILNSSNVEALQVVKEGLTAPTDVSVDHANQQSMALTQSISEGKVQYKFGDQTVFSCKVELMSKTVGDIIGIISKWVTVVCDIFSIVATLIGVVIASIDSAKRFKAMTDITTRNWDKLKNLFKVLGSTVKKAGEVLEKVEKTKKILEGIRNFIKGIMKLGKIVWQFVKSLLSSLRWWEILIAVVSFVASLVILVATEGGSLIAKLVLLAAQVVLFTAHVVLAVDATIQKA